MKLITVEASFAHDTLVDALQTVQAQADNVRTMSGCDHYAVYENATGLAIIQRWRSMDAFDAYRSSEVFAGLIATLKPLMSAPPVTTVATTDTMAK